MGSPCAVHEDFPPRAPVSPVPSRQANDPVRSHTNGWRVRNDSFMILIELAAGPPDAPVRMQVSIVAPASSGLASGTIAVFPRTHVTLLSNRSQSQLPSPGKSALRLRQLGLVFSEAAPRTWRRSLFFPRQIRRAGSATVMLDPFLQGLQPGLPFRHQMHFTQALADGMIKNVTSKTTHPACSRDRHIGAVITP